MFALTDHLDRLCTFFGCRIEQLAEHIPDAELPEGTTCGDKKVREAKDD